MTEDEMVGWHHQLNGHEFEQTLGDSEGQGSRACCSPRGRRVGHDFMTEQQQLECWGKNKALGESWPVCWTSASARLTTAQAERLHSCPCL